MEIERLKNEISSLKDELIASVKAIASLKDEIIISKDEIIISTKANNLLNQKVSNLEKEIERIINKRLSSSN
jgi:hypothetical protein